MPRSSKAIAMSRNAPACHINTDLKGASAGSFHWTTLYGVNDPGPFGIILIVRVVAAKFIARALIAVRLI